MLYLCLFSLPAFANDAAFERVMEKRELRCAYTIYPPFIIKDPNTGKFSGLFHDFLEQMGKELGIKIVWAEEVGSDNIFHGLNTDRYDAVCAGYFATPSRANGGSFTKPLVFVPTYAYVRADDTRFEKAEDLNRPDVTIATMDGEFSQIYRNEHLSQTKEMAVSGLTQAPERFEMVAGGKADATIAEAVIGGEYMAANLGKVKPLGVPAHIGGSVIVLSHDAYQLREYLNTAIDSMIYSGALTRIIDQYQKYDGSFLPPAKPYEVK